LDWEPKTSTDAWNVIGAQQNVPTQVLHTKISLAALMSPATRLVASDAKAMNRAAALIDALKEF